LNSDGVTESVTKICKFVSSKCQLASVVNINIMPRPITGVTRKTLTANYV
jgi:hypothetical protein